jgi:3-oxoacid CoA-transferase subunit B/glutaconate CoA-transferase subunit B
MATETEKMIVAASRLLENDAGIYVGTGMPLLASVLALNTHAPDLLLVFEGGGVGGKPTGRLPIQVSESLTYENGVIVGSMDYVMSLAQAGWIEYGFLGGAQIDQYGNLNTTMIGDWEQPKLRLPGSGGGADIASFCEKNIILTSPGYLTGPGEREKAGLPLNTGPYRVITQIGIYGFDEETKKMTLLQLFEGNTLEDVQALSSFPIEISENWSYVKPPTEEELQTLHALDPDGIVLA